MKDFRLIATTTLSQFRTRRYLALLTSCLCFALILNFFSVFSSLTIPSLPSGHWALTTPSAYSATSSHGVATKEINGFWPQFWAVLVGATPRAALPHDGVQCTTPRHIPFVTTYPRQDTIRLNPEDEAELRFAHTWFVDQISKPSFPKPYFVPGSSGIVTSAGGSYFPQALVAIRMLRRTGSTLPVDVYLANPEEDEGNICTEVFPTLGARCRILSQLLDDAGGSLPRRLDVTHFQLKVFAMLLSEFDKILWLDADNLPLIDPRPTLEGTLLNSTGLVTWPDYWAETVSPNFYRITGVPLGRVPVATLRAASESSQLLISKSTGLRTLLLSTYYNYHGPSHYYRLIASGAWGGGDKDTFLAAAMALDAPYYDVKTPVQTIGYIHGGEQWLPQGMLQANPDIDFTRWGNGSNHTGFDFVPDDSRFTSHYFERVPAAFLHSVQRKPHAGWMAEKFRTERPHRMLRPLEHVLNAWGFDVEKAIWEDVVWSACGAELKGHVFKTWFEDEDHHPVDPGDLCSRVQEIYGTLFEGKKWKDDDTTANEKAIGDHEEENSGFEGDGKYQHGFDQVNSDGENIESTAEIEGNINEHDSNTEQSIAENSDDISQTSQESANYNVVVYSPEDDNSTGDNLADQNNSDSDTHNTVYQELNTP